MNSEKSFLHSETKDRLGCADLCGKGEYRASASGYVDFVSGVLKSAFDFFKHGERIDSVLKRRTQRRISV